MGDWRKNLAKTPILVLFIVLISMGVGTASALITITLAGDVHVLGEMKIDETLLMGTDNPNDDDGIRFDDGSKVLFWDESETQFEFTDALVTSGVIQAGNAGADVAYNRIGGGTADSVDVTNTNDLFVSDDVEIEGNFYAGGDMLVGTSDGSDNDFIFFDGGLMRLSWIENSDQFSFNNDVVTNGVIQTGDPSANLGYNRIGSSTASATDISNSLDLFVSDSLEVGDDLYLGRTEGDRDIKFFEDGVSDGERFQWDDSADAFEVSDDFTVFGKLTATLGVDPPYVSFSAETHDSIKQLAQNVEEHEVVMQFWNKDNNRFEVYVILQDAFYTLDGKEVKYQSSGIPENSAINRQAKFEEQEKIESLETEIQD